MANTNYNKDTQVTHLLHLYLLLCGHALRQIPWLIHVEPTENCQMVRQQLSQT
jgi:hypothetical protein